jgi:beta-glucosidase
MADSSPQQAAYTFQDGTDAVKNGSSLSDTTQRILNSLTKAERLSLLDGDERLWAGLTALLAGRYNSVPYSMGAIERLGIPGVRFSDGPRGIVVGNSTAFPVSMARGATWDVDLERRIGGAIGKEGRAQGANFYAGVCVNLPRHPAWGRIQETYSDDPLLLGEFGHAFAQGVQEQIMACVKHFALNSMENARFHINVEVAEDVLHEVYLPHFRRIVEGGVASVMSAYNAVNGEWCGQSRKLLTEILRETWKFDGFTMSDFVFGFRDPSLSVKNGLDVEAPFSQQRAMHLEKALQSGELDWEDVDKACTRILSKQLDFVAGLKTPKPDKSVVFCDEHRALAREAAQRSVVLLKNERVGNSAMLPLQGPNIGFIALVGRLANVANIGDHGSSKVEPPHVVTPYEGLKKALPSSSIVLEDTDSPEKAKDAASKADVAICIVGYDHHDEGEHMLPNHDTGVASLFPPPTPEDGDVSQIIGVLNGEAKPSAALTQEGSIIEAGSGGDRKSLRLRPNDVSLIEAVTAANPRTIVVIVAAGAVIIEEWKGKVPAILMGWYAGSEGGHALADVLLGRTNPSGRLPFSVPKSEEHLPYFDMNAKKITYNRWHGQHLLDRLGVEAAFPSGFGLSYTTFAISDLHVGTPDLGNESIDVKVSVKNTGSRIGRFIAQVYGLSEQPDFPKRVLLGFAPVDLEAGESKTASICASLRPLQRWREGKFSLETSEVTVEAAAFAGDPKALQSLTQLKK